MKFYHTTNLERQFKVFSSPDLQSLVVSTQFEEEFSAHSEESSGHCRWTEACHKKTKTKKWKNKLWISNHWYNRRNLFKYTSEEIDKKKRGNLRRRLYIAKLTVMTYRYIKGIYDGPKEHPFYACSQQKYWILDKIM